MNQNSPQVERGGSKPDVIDAVFDNVCPVPDNIGDTVAKEEITIATGGEETSTQNIAASMDKQSDDMESPQTMEEMKKGSGEEDAMENVLSKFDINCCVKNPTKQIEDSKPEAPEIADEPAISKADDPSLGEIAARMNEIDLESGSETAEDEFRSDVQKTLVPWYREPFYASLIVLCVLFTIAIVVMAVLLFKK